MFHDYLHVPGLRREVQRRVALGVGRVEVDVGDVLEELEHLDHPVPAEERDRSLQRNDAVSCKVSREDVNIRICLIVLG